MSGVATRHGRGLAGALLGLALLVPLSPAAGAGTFGELSAPAIPPGMAPMVPPVPYPGGYYPGMAYYPAPYVAGPYAGAPAGFCPPDCYPMLRTPIIAGPEGAPPPASGAGPMPYVPPMAAAPRDYLPLGGYADGPNGALMLWSFGQYNATTDPFNPWGYSTPYMFVPWSTPLAGWTNATAWNWWRERSGALPRNW